MRLLSRSLNNQKSLLYITIIFLIDFQNVGKIITSHPNKIDSKAEPTPLDYMKNKFNNSKHELVRILYVVIFERKRQILTDF